jgi:hypothetical protein
MDTDFKVWLGIIRSMSEYGVKDTLNCLLLSSLRCGFDSRRSNKNARPYQQLPVSNWRPSRSVQNERPWLDHTPGAMAHYDINEDIVEIKAELNL